jgi:AcrR family transcriptional regulator
MTPAASPTTKRTLSTAEERRESVLEAGMSVFAERGFLGTPTTDVARAAGISQAYLFRLFPTKAALVVAVVERANQRIYESFAAAAAQARAAGTDPLMAMADSYSELLTDRVMLMTQVHQHAAAASMPEVAEASRRWFSDLYDLVERETDLPGDEIHRFFATGMLLNVMAAIGATDEHGPWAQTLRVC